MDRPVLCGVAALAGAALKDDRREGLVAERHSDQTEEGCHDQRYPCRPPPAEIRLGYETTNDGTSDRANECGACKQAECKSSFNRIPEVC